MLECVIRWLENCNFVLCISLPGYGCEFCWVSFSDPYRSQADLTDTHSCSWNHMQHIQISPLKFLMLYQFQICAMIKKFLLFHKWRQQIFYIKMWMDCHNFRVLVVVKVFWMVVSMLLLIGYGFLGVLPDSSVFLLIGTNQKS